MRCGLLVALLALLAGPVLADHPAVAFYLVERTRLEAAVAQTGSLAKVDAEALAEALGYFEGDCRLSIKAGTIRLRLRTTDDGRIVDYDFSLYHATDPPRTMASRGRLEVGTVPAAKTGWEQEPYVLLLQRVDLKR